MQLSRRGSITVIAATLLAAGWVAALLARSEGPPSATSVSDTRAAQTPASKPAPPAGQKPGPGPQAAATYIGDAACIDCHDDQKKSYFNTMHGRVPITRDRRRPNHGLRNLPRPRVGPRGRPVNRRRDSRLLEDPAA